MTKASALLVRRFARLGLAVVMIALIAVPAIARARQRVERHDATRLSIRHSWLGVAPPTKSTVTPQPIVGLPGIVSPPEAPRLSPGDVVAPMHALHPVLDLAPEPLRGPPSVRPV